MTKFPTDKRGIPLTAAEAGVPYIESEKQNNHHRAYFKRMFGSTAISQTFRDLDRFQEIMPVNSHIELHKRFAGIALPAANIMLDEISEAQELGETLKIYNLAKRQYEHHPILDERLDLLKQEYNALSDDEKPLFI